MSSSEYSLSGNLFCAGSGGFVLMERCDAHGSQISATVPITRARCFIIAVIDESSIA